MIRCGKKIHCIDPDRDRGVRRRAAVVHSLMRERFSSSLSFFPSNNWQYNLLPFLCGVRNRVAFDYPLKKGGSLSFLNTRFLAIDPALHDIDQNLRFAGFFSGTPAAIGPHDFPPLYSEKDREPADRFLADLGGPARYVGVHAGSSAEHGMAAKRWDPMRFGELATRICDRLGAQALLFGGGDEERIKLVAASVMRSPHRVVEPRPLPLTAALISRCSVFLCNDSGLMHMAACMGVPTLALFGPTDEHRNGPAGPGHLVVRTAMHGFPLWTASTVGVRSVKPGIDPAASLKALTVEEAWEKARPWLDTVAPSLQ